METARDMIAGCLVAFAAAVAAWTLGHWASPVLAQVQTGLLWIGRCV